jgi:hypothetical protein
MHPLRLFVATTVALTLVSSSAWAINTRSQVQLDLSPGTTLRGGTRL